MPYTDRKIKKGRRRSWTKEDERRWERERRQEQEREKQEREKREAMLAAMSEEERQAFLDAENEVEKKRQAEQAKLTLLAHQRHVEAQQLLADEARATTGYLQSELAASIGWGEVHGLYDGDWIDDPVAAASGQGGFGEEVRATKGIKLQVNICLDVSNSMVYNGLSDVSVAVIRTLYLSLFAASKDLLDDSLIVNLWTWAGGEDGKHVRLLSTDENYWGEYHHPFEDEDDPLGTAVSRLPQYPSRWNGQDTWMYPLMEELESWENTHGDAGAYRLDLIVSDGVMEHPTDVRKCDEIQDRRDGTLQSVVLNFLPMEEWADYSVPNRCVQYPADLDNLFGLIRQILGDWLVSI